MYELLKLGDGKAGAGSGDVTWVDVDVSDAAGAGWLAGESGLSNEVKSQLVHPGKFSRRESLDQGLLVTVCTIDPANEGEGNGLITLGLFLEEHRVISVRSRTIAPLEEVRRQVKAGRGPRTPLAFMAFLIVCIKKRIEPLIARISEQTAELEDKVLGDDSNPPSEALNAFRREVFRLKRYLSSFETLVHLIRSDPTIEATDEERRALNGAAELVASYLSAVEDCRERTLLLHDLIEARSSQTMSRATYNLTIVATVFLPLTFVTGLLGMNVAGIPESHTPWGFWIVVVALIVLAVASWAWLRWNKWLIS